MCPLPIPSKPSFEKNSEHETIVFSPLHKKLNDQILIVCDHTSHQPLHWLYFVHVLCLRFEIVQVCDFMQ